jgi:CubicO group peptidase (beta-lactamase class C family)
MASIIEKVSGQSFKDYMQENVFTPLGMSSSFVFNTRRSGGTMPVNYALGYVYSDSLQKYVLPDSTNFYSFVKYLDGITGDGIVNSTTADMLKWDRALKNHTLLSEQMQNEMFTPQALYDTAAGVYYGYGVFIDSTIDGKRIFHGGAWPGYSTNLTRMVDNDLTIIMLSNNYTYTTTMAFTIAHIYAGREFVVPYEHKEAKIDNSVIDKYTGKYKAPNNHIVELVNVNGKLMDRQQGRDDIEMKPESSTKFFSGDGSDVQMEFDSTGKAYLIETGLKIEMKRI